MKVLAISILLTFTLIEAKFKVAYRWKSLNFNHLEDRAGDFNFSHPVPFGIARHENRMFVGVARRNTGIPFTLAYFNLNSPGQNPPLEPYPNVDMNTISTNVRIPFAIRETKAFKRISTYQLNL